MMTAHLRCPLRLLVRICCWVLLSATAAPVLAADAKIDYFERHIRPLLVKHCYECHSPAADKLGGNLSLATREASRQGGDSGPAIVPGDVDGSLLVQAIRYESFEMPPTHKLPDDAIAKVERWIEAGAADPRDGKPGVAPAAGIDMEQGKQFWAFQVPQRHERPAITHAQWPQKSIDWYILNKLEQAGLAPARPAERHTLIRRVTFDLTGLPPTPAEIEAFVSDDAPDAYARLVERLMASPQYGVRWARMWLDVARYAEDQAHIVGNNSSLFYPNAYLYRDWVIQAFNQDVPYDVFIREQLAADLLHPDASAEHIALGFIGLGPKYYRRNDLAVMADEWEDRVDTVGRGLLGLTLACARCHDHKFDPIETEDYYALAGVFASTEMFNRPLAGKKAEKNGQTKKPADAMHIVRDKSPRDLNVFIRGDVKSPGPVVPRRFIRVLSEGEPEVFGEGSGRRQLAEALTSRDNPLSARVIVNRIWALTFGQPLVSTPSNFGSLGEMPTHPELLDDLAVRFMDAGWSVKWLHRELVLSSTYRQSSHGQSATQKSDPANRLLGRMHRRRLPVEAWRDALLAVTDRLDTQVGGPSIDPQDPDASRRTLYSRISRLDLNPMLAMFDFPDPNAHAAGRAQTTTPIQKLFALNSPFMVRQAEAFVARLLADPAPEPDAAAARIGKAYLLLYGREPSPDELLLGREFLQGSGADPSLWTQYAQVLLASNEALFID